MQPGRRFSYISCSCARVEHSRRRDVIHSTRVRMPEARLLQRGSHEPVNRPRSISRDPIRAIPGGIA